MTKIILYILLGIIGSTVTTFSQEIPGGVEVYMQELQYDPNIKYGFDYAKRFRFIDQDVQFKEWYVGLPFQYYGININKLENASGKTNLADIIEPTNQWCIPIRITNSKIDSYVFSVKVIIDDNDNSKFIRGGCGSGVVGFNTWDRVRNKFPEESGIRPIYIPYPYQILYFPHKNQNGRNVFYAGNPKHSDRLSKLTSKSLDNLDDEKMVIPLLMEQFNKHKRHNKIKTEHNSNNNYGGKK